MLVIKAGICKMLVRIANREDPDLGLLSLPRPFWQTVSVQNFRTFTVWASPQENPFSAFETWSQGYKTFSCSTQLSTKFQLLIRTEMPINEEVSCCKSLRCCIYHANKC